MCWSAGLSSSLALHHYKWCLWHCSMLPRACGCATRYWPRPLSHIPWDAVLTAGSKLAGSDWAVPSCLEFSSFCRKDRGQSRAENAISVLQLCVCRSLINLFVHHRILPFDRAINHAPKRMLAALSPLVPLPPFLCPSQGSQNEDSHAQGGSEGSS